MATQGGMILGVRVFIKKKKNDIRSPSKYSQIWDTIFCLHVSFGGSSMFIYLCSLFLNSIVTLDLPFFYGYMTKVYTF